MHARPSLGTLNVCDAWVRNGVALSPVCNMLAGHNPGHPHKSSMHGLQLRTSHATGVCDDFTHAGTNNMGPK